MKRLIPAVILAVFLAVMCVTAYTVTAEKCEETRAFLKKCETADVKELQNTVDRLYESWNSTSRLLSVFTSHDLLDEVSYCTAYMRGFALSGKTEEVRALCLKTRQYLSQLEAEQRFCIECFY